MLNTTGKKYFAECVASKENTKDIIEILAKYDQCNCFPDFFPIINGYKMFRV